MNSNTKIFNKYPPQFFEIGDAYAISVWKSEYHIISVSVI